MKKIFITGASAGIGLATTRALVDRGEEVWGTSRDPGRLLQHPRFHPVKLDLANPGGVAAAFRTALASAGNIDVVINNAGGGMFIAAESFTADELRSHFETLAVAHIELMQEALAVMRARGGGLIINVTSLASRLPVPYMAAYNAAKAAMAVYTMTLQLESPRDNVRVVDLQPADIRTNFNAAMVRKAPAEASPRARFERVWRAVDKNMRAAPPPELVARRMLQLIDNHHPPARVTVGSFFQACIAPAIFRFFPQRLRIWSLKMYYGL